MTSREVRACAILRQNRNGSSGRRRPTSCHRFRFGQISPHFTTFHHSLQLTHPLVASCFNPSGIQIHNVPEPWSTTTRIADPKRGAQAKARQGKEGWAISATLGSAASSITYGAQKACGMTTATTATTTTTKGTTECRRAREQTLGQQDRLAKLMPRAVANYLEDHRTEQAQTPVPCWEE